MCVYACVCVCVCEGAGGLQTKEEAYSCNRDATELRRRRSGRSTDKVGGLQTKEEASRQRPTDKRGGIQTKEESYRQRREA